MDTSVRFAPPAGTEARAATASVLLDRYVLSAEGTTSKSVIVYDTFDWRLFQKGWFLLASEDEVALLPLAPKGAAYHADTGQVTRWAADLPNSELRATVARIAGVRALLPVAQGQVAATTWRVLNEDGKTVARIELQEAQAGPPSAPMTGAGQLVVHEVRGYGKDRRRLAAILQAAGWQEIRQHTVILDLIALAGRAPGDYSTGLDLQLAPTMRSDKATKVILRRILAIMRTNEPFVVQDIDVEFLHDYRIAIRRTRSVLGQLGRVFAPEIVERFRQDFAAMGRASNRLRDLDVYLLRQQEYTAMLPPELRDGIGPLFDHLQAQRASALAEVATEIESPRHAAVLRDWEVFLSEPCGSHPEAADAGRLIIDFAQQRIWKRYRRIVKAGNRLLNGDVDEAELHALRIEFKKLRYLLEFFESLFPRKTFKWLVRQLKEVQEILGEINDLRMQETYLEQIAQELPIADARDRATILAVGCLVGKLDDRKDAAIARFAPAFERFASAETKARFRELAAIAERAREEGTP